MGEPATDVTAEAVQTDRGWQVAVDKGGERSVIDQVHTDRETAEMAARELQKATSRWEGAELEEPPEVAPHEQSAS